MELKSKRILLEEDLLFDNIINFKELKIYPIKLKDSIKFEYCIPILLMDQYNDRDINKNLDIFKMTYLDYIFFYHEREKQEGRTSSCIFMLFQLFSLVFQLDFFREDSENRIDLYKDEKNHYILKINDISINGEEFSKLKRIICEQNGIDISIFDLDPQVRKLIEETQRIKSKIRQYKEGSLEDKIIALSVVTHIPFNEICDFTIRKFKKYTSRANHIMDYKIMKQAQYSGFVKFEKEFPDWLSDIEYNVSEEVSSYGTVKSKINMANQDFDK